MTKTHKERVEEVVDALCAEVYEDWNLDVIPECREEWRAPIRTTILTIRREMLEDRVKKMEGMKIKESHIGIGGLYTAQVQMEVNQVLQTLIDADRKELEELTKTV